VASFSTLEVGFWKAKHRPLFAQKRGFGHVGVIQSGRAGRIGRLELVPSAVEEEETGWSPHLCLHGTSCKLVKKSMQLFPIHGCSYHCFLLAAINRSGES
jgi:hypothetical protein